MPTPAERDAIIEASAFRRNIYNMIPHGARRILDFGCGSGALLLRLARDKGCTELYGVELDREVSKPLEGFADKLWHANIEKNFAPFEDFQGHFDFIVMHDVVEHLYDPWHTLPRIRSLLSENGRLLLATPNFHYWGIQQEVLAGRFPYGPGLWHTGHIRWYTPASLVELLVIGGLSINTLYLEIPEPVDLSRYATGGPVTSFTFPPEEHRRGLGPEGVFTVGYGGDVSRYCPVFYAHKLLADCGRGTLYFTPEPVTNNCLRLLAMRERIDNPYGVFNPPPMTPLVGNWD